jgi:hypothetical protein
LHQLKNALWQLQPWVFQYKTSFHYISL